MSGYDAIILGAGSSGLTAAYSLARAGAKVVLIERSAHVGGLMRGIRRGDFCFDLGRKELDDSRFPDVSQFWSVLLGDDYRVYPHLVGLLWEGRILEKSSAPRGPMRGMSVAQAAQLGLSFCWSQVRPGARAPRNLEEYVLLRHGRAYYDFFIRGYTLKFEGRSPKDMPPPGDGRAVPRFASLQKPASRNAGAGTSSDAAPQDQQVWRHPARGTGQIVELCEQGARAAGAEFFLNTEVLGIGLENGQVRSVRIRTNGTECEFTGSNLITSLRMPLLLRLLSPAPPPELRQAPKDEVAFKKSTALVYLMADGEPRFPHNWVEVTDMRLKVGRVVNYATWNGTMVPPGKTGLCMEYFCVEGDGMMELADDQLLALARKEAAGCGLIEDARIFDTLVMKLPHANAATQATDWQVQWMLRATEYVNSLRNLYDTNRPGVDRAAQAGLDAAAACLTGRAMSGRSLARAAGAG